LKTGEPQKADTWLIDVGPISGGQPESG